MPLVSEVRVNLFGEGEDSRDHISDAKCPPKVWTIISISLGAIVLAAILIGCIVGLILRPDDEGLVAGMLLKQSAAPKLVGGFLVY